MKNLFYTLLLFPLFAFSQLSFDGVVKDKETIIKEREKHFFPDGGTQNAEKIRPFRTISVDVRIRTVAFECCILFEKCLYGTRAKYAQPLAPKHFTTQGTHVNSYDLCTFANAPQNKHLPIMHTLDHHMTEFCL